MRVRFENKAFEPMVLEYKGHKYTLSELTPLANKMRPATRIVETVYRLPTGDHIYLTVVGDEDQTSHLGIHKGWYLIESITKEEAVSDIEALAAFTDIN
jgi:hypothetical protein